MVLKELTGIKNRLDSSMEELIIKGIQKNYKLIGNGSFGMVFDNPIKSNEVIKIWVNDPGYEAFLEYAMKHPTDNLIKVFKLGKLNLKFKKKNVTLKYARIEKLTKKQLFNRFGNDKNGFELNDAIYFLEEYGLKTKSITDLIKAANKFFNPTNIKDELLPDDLIQFLIICFNLHKAIGKGFELDIVQRNIMTRGNTFVIVDPYYTLKGTPLFSVIDETELLMRIALLSKSEKKSNNTSLDWD